MKTRSNSSTQPDSPSRHDEREEAIEEEREVGEEGRMSGGEERMSGGEGRASLSDSEEEGEVHSSEESSPLSDLSDPEPG